MNGKVEGKWKAMLADARIYTEARLAAELDISPTTLWYYRTLRRQARWDILEAIARKLGTSEATVVESWREDKDREAAHGVASGS